METAGIQASLAGRYASALFDLAKRDRQIEVVEASLTTLEQSTAESDDLRRLIASPLVARGAAAGAIKAVATQIGLDALTANFLGVLATNRRLSQLRQVTAAFRQMAANHRGETSAEVTSAHPLDDAQMDALRAKLRARLGGSVGRDVSVHMKTDPAILGGLIVRIGSQMIDGSIRTKLNTLATAMKG